MKFNMQEMLAQAQKVQQEFEHIKTEIANKTVTAESGGGMVKVRMKGNNHLLEIKINRETYDPNDLEMLEDLIVAAVNKANQEVAEMAAEEMKKASGMLPNIPGLDLNF